jgi:hypothetical protein
MKGMVLRGGQGWGFRGSLRLHLSLPPLALSSPPTCSLQQAAARVRAAGRAHPGGLEAHGGGPEQGAGPAREHFHGGHAVRQPGPHQGKEGHAHGQRRACGAGGAVQDHSALRGAAGREEPRDQAGPRVLEAPWARRRVSRLAQHAPASATAAAALFRRRQGAAQGGARAAGDAPPQPPRVESARLRRQREYSAGAQGSEAYNTLPVSPFPTPLTPPSDPLAPQTPPCFHRR